MGNRAVICTREAFENNGVGIYIHWNGGRDSVEAFLKYCEIKGYGETYSIARLTQVIANFFGGTLSIEVDCVNNLDCNNYDNGVYIIDGWKIVDRKYFNGNEQSYYDMPEMLVAIDEAQPTGERLGKEVLFAEEVPVSDIVVGDRVVIRNLYTGITGVYVVMGIGEDKMLNGTNVYGFPYVARCGEVPADNINNYILTQTVRKVNTEDER